MNNSEKAWTLLRSQIRQDTLATHLGISRAAVNAWTKVPEARVRAVAAYFNLPPAAIRPDLYDPWDNLTAAKQKEPTE